MACPNCNLEMCYVCEAGNELTLSCCCNGLFGATHGQNFIASLSVDPEEPQEKRGRGRPRLDPSEMTNPLKAGRVRAERDTTIEGVICAWANLKFAGGGIDPIIGCVGLAAGARHHGPDKGTLNNEVGVNLHIICHTCHNRWHANNDKYYGSNGRHDRPKDGSEWLPLEEHGECKPHDPDTKATDDEMFKNEIWWSTPKAKREVEELISARESFDLTDETGSATLNGEDDENDELLGSSNMAEM